jgi:hypothetical protein
LPRIFVESLDRTTPQIEDKQSDMATFWIPSPIEMTTVAVSLISPSNLCVQPVASRDG